MTALLWDGPPPDYDTHAGLQVCGEALNGAEGISQAAGLKPDVVVLDFSMPVMNGVEAAVNIRKSVPEAHLLMFTPYGTPTIEDAARSAGIEDCIDKDDPAKLLQTLRQLERETQAVDT